MNWVVLTLNLISWLLLRWPFIFRGMGDALCNWMMGNSSQLNEMMSEPQPSRQILDRNTSSTAYQNYPNHLGLQLSGRNLVRSLFFHELSYISCFQLGQKQPKSSPALWQIWHFHFSLGTRRAEAAREMKANCQEFIAMSLFDPLVSVLAILTKQNSPSICLFPL